MDLQRRLISRQFDVLATIGPDIAAIAPPPETRGLHLLADGLPVLRGSIGPIPVDRLEPLMVELAGDISAVTGQKAAARIASAISGGGLDPTSLLAHVYQRDQTAVAQLANEARLVVDLVWLIGDLVVAPIVHVEQISPHP